MGRKIFCSLLLSTLLPYWVSAQKIDLNYGIIDSAENSLAYKKLHENYDEVVAYTTEGYWHAGHISYIFLAVKNGVYFKGAINLKKNKNNVWSNPVIKYKKIKAGKGGTIYQFLEKTGLWKMDNDSLNNQNQKNPEGSVERLTLSDGINYRFELIKGNKFLFVEAYEPEYFFKELPEYKQRQTFINIREEFLKRYKSL